MGSSISKDKELSIPENCLKFIEPFLKNENIRADLSLLNELQKPVINQIEDNSTIDQFVFERISSKLFLNNANSGNFRSLSLFFAEILFEKERELYISIENNKVQLDYQIASINHIIGLGIIIKFIIVHYLKNFGIDQLIKSAEHKQFLNFVNESNNATSEYFKELEKSIIFSEKYNEKQGVINKKLDLILYVCKSSKCIGENEHLLESFENLSVFGQFFSRIPSFLVCSQKYIENTKSLSEICNLLINLQNALMDIMLILFLPKIENNLNLDEGDIYTFITCFQIHSLINSEKNIYCEDDSDYFEDNRYLFLQYLIKKSLDSEQKCQLFEINRKKSILLLATILFNPPELKFNIYAEWIKNFSDPRFIPDSLASSDSNTDSDLDLNQTNFVNFPYFEQAYRSVIFDGTLVKHHLSVFLLYSLVHSNSYFISYCLSRADPDALILALLEPVYIISKNMDETNLRKIVALLSIILRLTNDPNLCKALHYTKIENLPFWLEEDSLKKLIYKCNSNQEENEFEPSEKHSITIGNILLIVLLRTMFYNYKSSKDIYLCNIIYSIIENVSIYMKNFHWHVAEKLTHYIIFLNSQVYCSLNTYNGDQSNFRFFNRFYCGILMHKALLKLIIESLKDENLLSNSELIYIIIKFSLIAEIQKLNFFLKKCIYNYRIIDSKLTVAGKRSNPFPSVTEILNSIVEFYEHIKTITVSFENELINIENISTTENIYTIFQTIQNIILSKRQPNKIFYTSKHAIFTRNDYSEFRFYFKTIYFEYWGNSLN
ncbi:uncharacterized protein cubi_01815 [Cryptosporidium ubiquitum]|uniref:Dymeclin n=1 Tax=Cryptosporidium ubiquitum TaxID=857276 RepID=A0A1J4MM86_9CRYT|nr:uncharacterized protein cubi_01815 [Cryptosporidium ubiquitum]OII75294.1 hypothetical protein cubi_01815 [Cryptosporidium ubiquitum]